MFSTHTQRSCMKIFCNRYTLCILSTLPRCQIWGMSNCKNPFFKTKRKLLTCKVKLMFQKHFINGETISVRVYLVSSSANYCVFAKKAAHIAFLLVLVNLISTDFMFSFQVAQTYTLFGLVPMKVEQLKLFFD